MLNYKRNESEIMLVFKTKLLTDTQINTWFNCVLLLLLLLSGVRKDPENVLFPIFPSHIHSTCTCSLIPTFKLSPAAGQQGEWKKPACNESKLFILFLDCSLLKGFSSKIVFWRCQQNHDGNSRAKMLIMQVFCTIKVALGTYYSGLCAQPNTPFC